MIFCALIWFVKQGVEWRFGPIQSGVSGFLNQEKVDVLILGSSHTRQGIDVRILEKGLKQNCFAVAYNGMDPKSHGMVLDELYRMTKSKPSRVLVEAYVYAAGRDPQVYDARMFMQSPLSTKYRILDEIIYWQKNPWDPKRLFELTVSGGIATIFTFPVSRFMADRMSYKGSYTRKYLPGMMDENFSKVADDAYTAGVDDITLKASQSEALNSLFLFAKKNGLILQFFETPMPKDVLNIPQIARAVQELKAFIEEAGFTYVNFALDGSFDHSDPTHFTDWNHLSTKGRDLHSKMLAEWLKNPGT